MAADDRSAEVTQLLLSLRGVYDEDEAVDELDHALQSAAGAIRAQADDELVVASLLHDIARSPLVLAIPGYAEVGHEEVARRWLTPRFGERVGWLAGAHVAAKRYLAATDPEYQRILSPASIASLAAQGGAAVDPIWTAHPWWPAAVQLRRFDDGAKVIGALTPSVSDVVAITQKLK